MIQHTNEEILRYMERKYNKRCPLGLYLMDYFMARNLIVVADFGRGIEGVLIFKKTKLKKFDPTCLTDHDPKGDCAYVLELCADSKSIIAWLESEMRERVGKVRHLGMTRRGKVLFYDYEKFMNKLLGKDRFK